LYSLKSSYLFNSYVSETIIETNSSSFYLEAEDIYDFIVSDDNMYIAVLFFDMKSIDEQRLIIYDHSGSELYEYSMNNFWERTTSDQYNGSEVISFYGYAYNDEYLIGGLSHKLDIGVYFSINLESGELIVYGADNHDEYNALLNKFKLNR